MLKSQSITKFYFKKYSHGLSSCCVKPPEVGANAKHIYEQYVHRGVHGYSNISAHDLNTYNMYVKSRALLVRDIRILRLSSNE